ncbi:MAG: phenylalanine--tRNA ligase subunit beta [Candidatus Limnocylindrales bacterium]|jgi:phenylalanyl-tRNA synthetase beta chain
MRVPLSWLREYVDIEQTPERLAERLTLLGMEVPGVEQWGSDWRKVVVGELLAVEKHPFADRLHLTTVTVGSGEPLRIVCGANNIAPGQRVPVALPGAVLPGDRRIERTEKMGVVSEGMLCSGEELHITSDAEGILILSPATPLGRDLSELYGDVVLDVDVKPNRGDALCLIGLAREVAAATGAEVRWPEIAVDEKGGPVSDRLRVEVRETGLCTRFVGRWISDVRIGPSPDWVQMRLQAAGMRPVSNVVDASNYVMLELGKPTHTFNGAAVRDGTIVVRLARPGERLETLDHVDRELTPDTLIIADPSGPIGIAGVMGGAESEITADTTEIAIESAVFDPVSIRRTGHRYGLRSEASLRFEKGQEVRLARIGADRVAQLTLAWAGGTVARGRVDTAPSEPVESRLAFRPRRVSRLLGAEISTPDQRQLLRRVGVETELAAAGSRIQVTIEPKPLVIDAGSEETLVAIVPTWRRDLAIEADVAEEVARVRGYETIPGHLPDTVMPAYRPAPLRVRNMIRQTLAGAGLSEVVTHALVSPLDEARLLWPEDVSEPALPAGLAALPGDEIAATNALSGQHSVLRRHMARSLLDVLSLNERQGRPDVAIFEIGNVYARVEGQPREWIRLALLLSGAAEPPAWNRASRQYDLEDAKGLVELLCRRLGLPEPSYAPDDRGFPFHPGRALLARQEAGEEALAGRVAELHPDALAQWDLRAQRVIVAEMAILGLDVAAPLRVHVEPIPRFPEVERDLAVIVEGERPAAEVEATIRRYGGDLLRGVRLFDLYRGAPLSATEKSLAYRLVFGARDRTLTEVEVDEAIAEVRQGLETELRAHLRS